MTPNRALNWTLAALLALLLSIVWDSPTDHSTERASAQALEDAARADAQRLRFEAAAQRACGGPNAAWMLLLDGAVQCATKRGHKTIVARVQP